MAGETKSLGRKDKNDKFYTKESVAEECCKLIDFSKFNSIIEPSAGNGSFLNFLPFYEAFDIEPDSLKIKKQDFFSYDAKRIKKPCLVIGNPPFGIQGKLALDFFNYSATFADTIAFILPLSFKKNSVINKLNENFFLIKEKTLPKDSFLLKNKDYNVPCVFQIWEKQEGKRKKIKLKMTSDFFSFVKREEGDFRIQRVGGSAGKASLDLNRSVTSNYFIKNKTNISNEEFINLINKCYFPSIEWTVGPKSLPKGELIEIVENKIKEIYKNGEIYLL